MQAIVKKISRLNDNPVVVFVGLLATSLFLGARLYRLVEAKAVNLIFWDQFDFYTPLFKGQGWIQQFLWQHGVHRQGLGGILSKLVADASGWNGRSEAFFILGLVYLSLLLVLLLKWRLAGKLILADVVYPLIMLNIYQYEIFIGTTNIAPAGTSLFLICLYAVAWTVPKPVVRVLAVLAANFLAVFSGYSLFLGFVTAAVFIVEMVRAGLRRDRPATWLNGAALAISLLSLGAFSIGYQVYPSAGCGAPSLGTVLRYPVFMGLMLAKFTGLSYVDAGRWTAVAGVGLLLAFVGAGAVSLYRWVWGPETQKPAARIATALIGFTLLYCAGAAVGRTCLGMSQAQPSRYVTLLIPGFIGLFLAIGLLPRLGWRAAVYAVGLVLVLHSLAPFAPADEWAIDYYYSGKTAWKSCYLQTGDLRSCQDRTGFQVYPAIDQRIQGDFDYLQEHRLNLFLDL